MLKMCISRDISSETEQLLFKQNEKNYNPHTSGFHKYNLKPMHSSIACLLIINVSR